MRLTGVTSKAPLALMLAVFLSAGADAAAPPAPKATAPAAPKSTTLKTKAPPAPLPQAPAGTTPLAGNWAGDGFSLRVIRGGAMVQGKCANGKITAPIFVDSKGRFAVSGYFNPVTSGFSIKDVTPRDRPAQFTGEVKGDKLLLKMRSEAAPGNPSYKLQRNKPIKFEDCGRDTRAGLH